MHCRTAIRRLSDPSYAVMAFRGSGTDARAALAATQEARRRLERRFRWSCPLEAAMGRQIATTLVPRMTINYSP